jgi:Ran-binding protein 9/10
LIQSLVLQFLTHDGYVETARAFADEIQSEKQALNLDPNAVIQGFDVKEDEDAGHRQRQKLCLLSLE